MVPDRWDNGWVSKWTIAGAWMVVAGLATLLTWQIVSAADARVSDRPPLQVAAPLPGASDSTTSTTVGAEGSTTTTGPTPSTGPTTTPSSSTSTQPTTTAAEPPPPSEAEWSSRTVSTLGGTVVISYRPGEVVLSSASPAAGFAAEIKKAGPPDVDVEFESETARYRVRARWADGALSVEVEADAD